MDHILKKVLVDFRELKSWYEHGQESIVLISIVYCSQSTHQKCQNDILCENMDMEAFPYPAASYSYVGSNYPLRQTTWFELRLGFALEFKLQLNLKEFGCLTCQT